MAWSEARLLAFLARVGGGARGIAGSPMHDAAVLPASRGRTVVCVDQTIEGVHFAPGTPPEAVARKAVDRALSDLAATAARPRAILVALRAPPGAREASLTRLLGAARRRARAFGAELVGGDTAAAPGPLALSVTALGVLEGRARPPGRDRARPGQRVVLTGRVGGSPLGRHLRLRPRVDLGRALWRAGASGMMDVSDGLGLDLTRLAAASGVRIELERVPVHPDARRLAERDGGSAERHALEDGEDHELIATLAPSALARARSAAWGRGLLDVGAVRRGAGLWLRRGSGFERWRGEGWVHGRS